MRDTKSRSRPSKAKKKTASKAAAPKAEAEKKPRGRPSKFTKALPDEICRRLSLGESLRRICADDHMPDESAVRGWAVDNVGGFFPQYTRARDLGLDAMADEILDIADDGQNDWMEKQVGENTITVPNHEVLQRSKLRCEQRQWYLSKLAPKRYGQKVTLAGDEKNPVAVKDVTQQVLRQLTEEQLAEIEKAASENHAG